MLACVQAVAQFCLLAVVGMLLGIAFGAATSWLLDNIFRDPTLTTVVTLVSAYSSYYTADRLVGASGLLAVVCNGFTMSLIGRCCVQLLCCDLCNT
jgi:NhaP-type Na+/H+ or K+/H+ antiporter